MGRRHPGPAQQQPDADDGQLRHVGRPALRLCDAGEGGCMQQSIRSGYATGLGRSDKYPKRRRGSSPFSLGISQTSSTPCSASSIQFRRANHMLEVPYMPYLNWAPSAWVLPLKFTGGGYVAGGKCMFDSEGNLWVGDNFTVGWQGQDSLWQGHATKFAPNGNRSRRLPRVSRAAAWKAAPSALRSIPMTTRGSPRMAARPFPYSTRTGSL